MGWQSTQITTVRAFRLGPPPLSSATRWRRAASLLRRGTATLAAVAIAWYDGDVDAARADIYTKGTRR